MTEIQNPKTISFSVCPLKGARTPVLIIENWKLRFICILLLVIWDL